MNAKIQKFIDILKKGSPSDEDSAKDLFSSDDPNLVAEALNRFNIGEDYYYGQKLAYFIAHKKGLSIRNLVNLSREWNHGPHQGSFVSYAYYRRSWITPCEKSFIKLEFKDQISEFLAIEIEPWDYSKVREVLRLSKHIRLDGVSSEIRDALADNFDKGLHGEGVGIGVYSVLVILLKNLMKTSDSKG